MPRSALLNVMVQAANKAGRSLTRDFNEVEKLQISVKGPADFVSAADLRAEKIIRRELEKARPGYGFLMEESGEIEGADKTHRWIVDPLDGTNNFLHGNPYFCVSIALEREGKIAAGVIYAPILDEIYTAEKGTGAYMNDGRIRVSARKGLEDAVISLSIPNRGSTERAQRRFRELAQLIPRVSGIRVGGASALDMAWLAAGRYDGAILDMVSAWDVAAGLMIIREAGGLVSDRDGNPEILETLDVIAGTDGVHEALLPIAQKAR
ncbi:MAG: inositol monophosphatase family protein [Pseudomonadota bacterium]